MTKLWSFCWLGCVGVIFCVGCRTPSVEAGAVIFRKNCAGCHSLEPDRRPNAPSLAGYFARNPSPTSRQTEELIMNGRRLMPPFRHRLSSDQIGDVIAFLKAQ